MNIKYTLLVAAALATPHLAQAAAPAWCSGLRSTNGNSNPDHIKDLGSTEIKTVLQAYITEVCVRNPDPQFDKILGQARDALTRRLDLHPDDWADIAAWTNDSSFPSMVEVPHVKALGELGPVQQFMAEKADFKNEREGGRAPDVTDSVYYLDALGSKLTETGRLAFLEWCVKGADDADRNLTKWAVCQGDMAAFDVKKMSSELHADTANAGRLRFYIRLTGFSIAPAIEAVNAAKKKLIASDKAYQQYFDAATAGAATWQKTLGTNTKLLELAEKMDSAAFFHSRSMLEGCDGPTTDALAEAVSTIAAKDFKGMVDDSKKNPTEGFAFHSGPLLANTPVVNVALGAWTTCHPDSDIATHYGYFLGQTPGMRGPRTAAETEMQRLKVKFDDTRKQEPAELNFDKRPWAGYTDMTTSEGGVVKTATKSGDKIKITVEKTSITQMDCVKEHYSNRIANISGGVVHYELICDTVAPVKHDTTPGDFEIDAKYEKVMKPGVRYSRFKHDVFATWAKKDAPLPNWVVFGTVK